MGSVSEGTDLLFSNMKGLCTCLEMAAIKLCCEENEYVLRLIVKAVLAGAIVGIGGIAYLMADSKLVGAVCFCIGIVTVLTFQLKLFTGVIGPARKKENLSCLLIAAGNYMGCLLMGTLAGFLPGVSYADMLEAKINKPIPVLLVAAVLCGVLMYVSVDGFKRTGSYIVLCLPIVVFILAGFEHSVANMFYFSLDRSFNLKQLLYILLAMLGNGVGAKLFDAGVCYSLKQPPETTP